MSVEIKHPLKTFDIMIRDVTDTFEEIHQMSMKSFIEKVKLRQVAVSYHTQKIALAVNQTFRLQLCSPTLKSFSLQTMRKRTQTTRK